jgi:hypothetical protein
MARGGELSTRYDPTEDLWKGLGTDINQVSGWLATIAEHTQNTVRLLGKYLE